MLADWDKIFGRISDSEIQIFLHIFFGKKKSIYHEQKTFCVAQIFKLGQSVCLVAYSLYSINVREYMCEWIKNLP